MGRKTVDVEYVKMIANRILTNEDPKRSGEREGVAMLLEAVLFETGNYKGFKWIPGSPDGDGTIREYL
jgi:hypothetical protein